MLTNPLFISLAPVFIIALYVYCRDKYEKEPFSILLKALLAGVLIVLPAVLIEKLLTFSDSIPQSLGQAAYTAFVVAALTEEGLKFLALYIFFRNDRNFNEPFDGIVYAVYIALGFAGIENLLYVFSEGPGVGILRALTAVPAHALFGVAMGYYFALARFGAGHRKLYLALAFLMPYLFHGMYDFLLMGDTPVLMTLFIPVFIYFWISGFRKMSLLSNASALRAARDEEENL